MAGRYVESLGDPVMGTNALASLAGLECDPRALVAPSSSLVRDPRAGVPSRTLWNYTIERSDVV